MKGRVNLLYFSATDTTAQTVKAIARGIGGDTREYDITLPEGRQKEMVFEPDDLVIVGAPVYMGRIPKFIIDCFATAKGSGTPAAFIALYGNREYEDALLELKDTFEKNGFIGIAGGAFIGEHSSSRKIATGRPDAEDKKIAEEFGIKIRNKLEALGSSPELPRLAVPGNFPYRAIPPANPIKPDTSDDCTNCGICAEHCPMGAISFGNAKDVDDTKCIRCSSCVKRCPVSAKSFNNEEILKRVEMMVANFGGIRKEPELFI